MMLNVTNSPFNINMEGLKVTPKSFVHRNTVKFSGRQCLVVLRNFEQLLDIVCGPEDDIAEEDRTEQSGPSPLRSD